MNITQGAVATTASQQPWRERDGKVVLLASRVAGRETLHFPPMPATSPLAARSELVELIGTPSLYSYTVVHSSPKANKAPQPLGQVDFPEGVRVFGRLDMPGGRRPVIGEPMRVCIEPNEAGPIYAFRPVHEEAQA
ncbi:OB-fold domain-containing protein [Variovorax robiniae]|uniref:OB-fold domain-containing protein n=1 Tax=Variovorax robiniae TaxID=1836199 RepID=A0ABU8XJE0_9BURK